MFTRVLCGEFFALMHRIGHQTSFRVEKYLQVRVDQTSMKPSLISHSQQAKKAGLIAFGFLRLLLLVPLSRKLLVSSCNKSNTYILKHAMR